MGNPNVRAVLAGIVATILGASLAFWSPDDQSLPWAWARIGAAYLASVFGGHLFAGLAVWKMRQQIGYAREFNRPIDWWVGGTERFIATSLTVWAPSLLAGFIAGWVALKMAANWQRIPLLGDEHRKAVARATLAALVGSAISFAVAVLWGVLAMQGALCEWAPKSSFSGLMAPGQASCPARY